MRIFDIFSRLPAKELSIEQIEEIFLKACDGIVNDKFLVVYEMPENADSNIIECRNELLSEGKQVAYIMQEDMIVAQVGYKN